MVWLPPNFTKFSRSWVVPLFVRSPCLLHYGHCCSHIIHWLLILNTTDHSSSLEHGRYGPGTSMNIHHLYIIPDAETRVVFHILTSPFAAPLPSSLVVGAGQVETHALRGLHALQHLRGRIGRGIYIPSTPIADHRPFASSWPITFTPW